MCDSHKTNHSAKGYIKTKLNENTLYKLTCCRRLPFGVRPWPRVLTADPSATSAAVTAISAMKTHSSRTVAYPRTAAIWLGKMY
jgi:hypothetical protein